jgi:GMP synthase (glutamine-hydrolysing)
MIVILNFGSQFAHLIARRVRELGVKAEILPFNAPVSRIVSLKPRGIILSGGPASVTQKGSPRPSREIFNFGVPVLGICYGEQVMAKMLGGKVKGGAGREFGAEILRITSKIGIFRGMNREEVVWLSHGDQVSRLPKNFVRVASTEHCRNAAICNPTRSFWGIQFHPEVTHTKHGKKLLENFLFHVCGAKKDWEVSALAKEIVESAKSRIGKSHVVIGISGGVDSLVAATVLYRAIGPRLHAVLVDTGLLRKNEAQNVAIFLRKQGFKNLYVARAEKVFLKRLKGVTDPEKKRRIIGHSFIEIFERTIGKNLKRYPVRFLAQGTIYPDRIESAEPTKHASKIKSHHNLTLPEKLNFEIIEPLRDLYKDEVRKLGKALGLPEKLLWRHPFPGPGLAVRIVGEITKERLAVLREADSIFIEELEKAGEYNKIWQAFAILLPLKSVGVMGDARTYEYMISLRAVDSVDGMSADWHKIPQELLERISSRIVREVRGVNRVLYDITQKPPATIEYE